MQFKEAGLFILVFVLGFILLLTGCSSGQPTDPSGSATVTGTAAAQTTAAVTQTATPIPVQPDCSPELYNKVGAKATYLLAGGRFTAQGGVIYYFTGGNQPALYKQTGEQITPPTPVLTGESVKNPSSLNVVGTKLYFISAGKGYSVNTDGTGLKEMFSAHALLAQGEELYFVNDKGLNLYSAKSSLLVEGNFDKAFVKFGRIFLTRENSEYGYDLLICSEDFKQTTVILEQCSFILSDDNKLYGETVSGMKTVNYELEVNASSLRFDLVPYAISADGGKIYYCDRADNNLYVATEDGKKSLLFSRSAQYIAVYEDRIIYESDGTWMHMELTGTNNTLLTDGLGNKQESAEGVSGKPTLTGIGNEPLVEGKSTEVALLLDGKTPEEKNISKDTAFKAIKVTNTDNVVAKLVYEEGKFILKGLNQGTTVIELELGDKSTEYIIRVVKAD